MRSFGIAGRIGFFLYPSLLGGWLLLVLSMPSSDGYKKKPIRPAIPKERKTFGGQPGHRGRTLKRVSTPDHVQVHLPPSCACCGRTFTLDEPYEVRQCRQVFDLPDPERDVTEHRLAQVTCCRRAQSGSYPAHVTASVQYGAGVRALVTKLSVDHRLPLAQISRLFEDLYGYELNASTVEDALRRGYGLAESVQAQVMAQLQVQPCVHFDKSRRRGEANAAKRNNPRDAISWVVSKAMKTACSGLPSNPMSRSPTTKPNAI